MSNRAQNLKDEAQEHVRQVYRRARRLGTQLERQLNEHFSDELGELRGTRDRVFKQVSQTSSRVTSRLLQDDVKLPQPLRAVLEQVSQALERWSEPACHAAGGMSVAPGSATAGHRAERSESKEPSKHQGRPEHAEAGGEAPRPRSSSRPRRRRKPAAASRNDEVTVPDGGADIDPAGAGRPKRP